MTKESLQAYCILRNEIETLQLKPGAMIREVDLASRFHVSRTPIRDVLKKLEADGLLEVHSQKGTYVAKIDLHGITDIMYIRNEVEYGVYRDLLKVVDDGNIVEFRHLLNDQKKLVDGKITSDEDIEAFFNSDNELHEAMYGAAGRKSVWETINASWPTYTRFRSLTYLRDASYLEMLFKIHTQMVDCIEAKDKEELRTVVRHHNFSGLVGIEDVESKYPDYFK